MSRLHSVKIEMIGAPVWQTALREAIRDVGELLALLEIDPRELACYQPALEEFPLLVPRSFAARMRKRDPADPLLHQVLPRSAEHLHSPGFSADPLKEASLAEHGVLRKYRGRALLITTAACPVHCRYCFRRHFPYETQLAARRDWQPALRQLENVDGIKEVILSGGDPLSLSTRRLAVLFEALERFGSLQAVRIHTRFPVVLPERVDAELTELINRSSLRTVVVIHCNHPDEIDAGVTEAMQALQSAGSALLNQSVLLRGINDDVTTLTRLSERLFACGALPYYLHLLDPVQGAAHFEVEESRGRALIAKMRAQLPGYLVPRLVREVPGELSKTPIA